MAERTLFHRGHRIQIIESELARRLKYAQFLADLDGKRLGGYDIKVLDDVLSEKGPFGQVQPAFTSSLIFGIGQIGTTILIP